VASRYVLIALTLAVMVYRLSQREWVAAAGLAGLAGGLIVLQMALSRPRIKPVAWILFGVTAVAMIITGMRMFAAR
jgi:hypothetical protein